MRRNPRRVYKIGEKGFQGLLNKMIYAKTLAAMRFDGQVKVSGCC